MSAPTVYHPVHFTVSFLSALALQRLAPGDVDIEALLYPLFLSHTLDYLTLAPTSYGNWYAYLDVELGGWMVLVWLVHVATKSYTPTFAVAALGWGVLTHSAVNHILLWCTVNLATHCIDMIWLSATAARMLVMAWPLGCVFRVPCNGWLWLVACMVWSVDSLYLMWMCQIPDARIQLAVSLVCCFLECLLFFGFRRCLPRAFVMHNRMASTDGRGDFVSGVRLQQFGLAGSEPVPTADTASV